MSAGPSLETVIPHGVGRSYLCVSAAETLGPASCFAAHVYRVCQVRLFAALVAPSRWSLWCEARVDVSLEPTRGSFTLREGTTNRASREPNPINPRHGRKLR